MSKKFFELRAKLPEFDVLSLNWQPALDNKRFSD